MSKPPQSGASSGAPSASSSDHSKSAPRQETNFATGTDTRPAIAKRFGTFGGVFTPSVLTILGVVMYMRLGWVTGQAGLGQALLIIGIAHLISLGTGLSVANIATDRTVGPGGAYYMISRALGAPAGAAIGIPLFFAQALSVTFYIVGFVESLQQIFPILETPLYRLLVATTVNILITGISMKNAELAIKAQYVVMAAIILSLVSFLGGTTADFPREIEWWNEGGASFEKIFAVFFPAVTGIMAGVSMSGDLKDPRRSIPRGTIFAIGTGFVVYMGIPIWLSYNMSNTGLSNNNDAMFTIAAIPQLIYVGVWGATLSSAIGSILTAPRTLQALAMDGLAPGFLARGYGANDEPWAGIAITFVLAQAGIALGTLDAIAPVLTMFFLATYGFTNLASGLQKWAASPAFRPTFRLPASVSLATGLACFYVMSIINLTAMMVATVFCGAIYFLMQGRDMQTTYGDARHGIWAALVRSSLQRLRKAKFHPSNWRPNMIILGGDPNKRPYLLHLGSAIVQDRGVVTYFHLLKGTIARHTRTRHVLFDEIEPQMAERFPNVFYKIEVSEDIYKGIVSIAQSYGIGSFEANSVMLGWPKKPDRMEAYVGMLRDLVRLDRSIFLVKFDDEKRFGAGQHIHIWWGGLKGNGGLMLLLSFPITAHYRWRKADVTVLTVVETEDQKKNAEDNMNRLLHDARIRAKARVVLKQDRPIQDIMTAESKEADLAIVGFALPDEGKPVEPFYDRMNEILDHLPTTLLVLSARHFEGDPVLFDKP